MALEQVQKNFAEMSILNDGIRNPLTLLAAQVEIYCPKIADIVTIQIKEIDDLITQLDRRWIQSEKVINYIRKHHGSNTNNPHFISRICIRPEWNSSRYSSILRLPS